MDAHYHQVMKAREAQPEGVSQLYFAYSTILDREAFEEWAQEHSYQFFELPQGQLAEALDVDLVFDFASRWWRGRVAGLTDKPGSSVYGMLFEIPLKNWPVVQHKEGFITGMCVERKVQVNLGGQIKEAIAFATNPARRNLEGPISKDFMEALIRGAKNSGLPKEYIQKLETVQG